LSHPPSEKNFPAGKKGVRFAAALIDTCHGPSICAVFIALNCYHCRLAHSTHPWRNNQNKTRHLLSPTFAWPPPPRISIVLLNIPGDI